MQNNGCMNKVVHLILLLLYRAHKKRLCLKITKRRSDENSSTLLHVCHVTALQSSFPTIALLHVPLDLTR